MNNYIIDALLPAFRKAWPAVEFSFEEKENGLDQIRLSWAVHRFTIDRVVFLEPDELPLVAYTKLLGQVQAMYLDRYTDWSA